MNLAVEPYRIIKNSFGKYVLRFGVVHTGFLSSLNRRGLKRFEAGKSMVIDGWLFCVCGKAANCENRVFVTRVNVTWKVKFVFSKRWFFFCVQNGKWNILISEYPEQIIVIFIQIIYKSYSSQWKQKKRFYSCFSSAVIVNRRNGATSAESYPQLTTSYSRTQNSRRSAFGSSLGSHPEFRYLKDRRDLFEKNRKV